jgi:hypothetical protein
VWRARYNPQKSGRVLLLYSNDFSLFAYSSRLVPCADYRGNVGMTSYEYYLKQTRIAVGLTLAEPDVTKAARLSLLALQYFDKAEKAKAGRSPCQHIYSPCIPTRSTKGRAGLDWLH